MKQSLITMAAATARSACMLYCMNKSIIQTLQRLPRRLTQAKEHISSSVYVGISQEEKDMYIILSVHVFQRRALLRVHAKRYYFPKKPLLDTSTFARSQDSLI